MIGDRALDAGFSGKTSGKRVFREHPTSGRLCLSLSGCVQGMGFRPFVFGLARSLSLTGFVFNDPRGVTIEVQGPKEALARFEKLLLAGKPSVSRIDSLDRKGLPVLEDERGFSIRSCPDQERIPSDNDFSSLLPDAAVCPDCLVELFDPESRRYRYPLISCTNCGPRFSIALSAPFDRCRTTLRDFPLCPRCQAEFEDPENRRFHAQTIGCPECGPKTRFLDGSGNPDSGEDPVRKTLEVLLSGGVLAIKGLGGYHLACDARNREAIRRIRSLKERTDKPLAVMTADVASAASLGKAGGVSGSLLRSTERPIVLVPVHGSKDFPYDLIAPGLDRIGILLPCTPIQQLLLRDPSVFGSGFRRPDIGRPEGLSLVMTSANSRGAPIASDEREVVERFGGKIDGFLVHERPIHHRLDDSLVLPEGRDMVILRRARGWVPQAFWIGSGNGTPHKARLSEPFILALGGHLKTAPCQIREGGAFVLPHMGDLDGGEVREEYRAFIRSFINAQKAIPTHLACDLHPDFFSTRLAFEWGREWGIPVFQVQHHHAHVASVMADRGLSGPVLGMALDGLGLGSDGTLWGGELLRVDRKGAVRLGHFRPLPLPGGDRASREPWRMGVSVLWSLGLDPTTPGVGGWRSFSRPGISELVDLLKKPGQTLVPFTSSAGRLFDAAYALLGGKEFLDYEGQGAMELEGWARSWKEAGHFPSGRSGLREQWDLSEVACQKTETEGRIILDFLPVLDRLREENKRDRGAWLFHEALALGLRDWAVLGRERTGIRQVVLSGGVFQNRLLARRVSALLRRCGFSVFEPSRVPANDGGLALGQGWVALNRIKAFDTTTEEKERRTPCVLPFRHA